MLHGAQFYFQFHHEISTTKLRFPDTSRCRFSTYLPARPLHPLLLYLARSSQSFFRHAAFMITSSRISTFNESDSITPRERSLNGIVVFYLWKRWSGELRNCCLCSVREDFNCDWFFSSSVRISLLHICFREIAICVMLNARRGIIPYRLFTDSLAWKATRTNSFTWETCVARRSN